MLFKGFVSVHRDHADVTKTIVVLKIALICGTMPLVKTHSDFRVFR